MISDRTLSRVLPRDSTRLYGDLIRVATAIAIVIAIAFVAIYYRFQGGHLNDFRVFYYSTEAWLNGLDMYGPTPATTVPVGEGRFHELWNMNPPHFHLLLLPFARVPLQTAKVAWVVVNVALLCVSLAAIARALGVRWTLAGTLWTLFAALVFSATCALVATGQLTWIIMLPVTLAWAAARRGGWDRAAVLLGIAASIKPFLGIFLVYFVLRRMWRTAVLMLGAGVVCGLVGLAVFGWDAQWRWIETLRSVDWPWAPMNASFAGYLTRVLSDNPFVLPLVHAPHLIRPIVLVSCAAAVIVTFRTLLRDGSEALAVDRAFAALLLLALLVSPLGWIYYLWLPAGPLVALFWFHARPIGIGARAGLIAAAPGLVWPLYPFLLFRQTPGAALTVAGIYFWTVLGLWLAVIAMGRRVHAA